MKWLPWHLRKDAQLDEELRSHFELAIQDRIDRGESPEAAEAAARRDLGNVLLVRERVRDMWGWTSTSVVMTQIDGILFDVRAAFRAVLRDRGFSVTAIATLAVAIALNVTVFTVREAMLFRGLPLAQRSDRLLYLAMRKPSDPACCTSPVRYSDFEAWRANSHAFEDLTFRTSGQPITFRDGTNRPLDMATSKHSVNTLGVLGVKPMLGRDFTSADEIAGAPPVAILSYQFWERRFNKRNETVGSIVHISGIPTTIIGVLPKGFADVYDEDLWMPLTPSANIDVDQVVARLRDGATIEQARVELETITQRLHASDPPASRPVPSVLTYSQAHVAPDAPVIYGTLWAGAWLVLVVACANLVNFTLVRTGGRWREYTTRIALGAGASRMVRQMLIESLMLAGVASVLAWLIIKWTVRTWADATASRYLALDYSLNAETILYLLSIATVAGIAIPLVAIVKVLRLRSGGALMSGARGVTQEPRGRRLATALVAGQMALAMVLLLGTGILVRSFEKIVGADTGVRGVAQVMTGVVRLPSDKYPTLAARVAFLDRLREEIMTIPGAEAVSFASTVPTRSIRARSVELEGRAAADGPEQLAVINAEADYFRTMGHPAIVGRDFDARDDAAAPRVVLVNEALAAAFWPGDTALGKRLRMIDSNVAGPWRTVVGVTPNIMQGDQTRQAFKPVIYVPIRQQALVRPFVFVRSRLDQDEIIQVVLAQVQKLDSDVITEEFSSLEAKFAFDRDWMDLEHADLGKHAAIAPVFSIIALVLAALGMFAVIAHSVTQRTKEIGVRMAIGAAGSDIATMIMREGMRPVATGLLAGLVAAAGSNRLLQSQLVGISPYDPVTLVGAPLILIAVSLIACRIPARHAIRVDPVVALRHD